jgi:hypothetical protein
MTMAGTYMSISCVKLTKLAQNLGLARSRVIKRVVEHAGQNRGSRWEFFLEIGKGSDLLGVTREEAELALRRIALASASLPV